MNYNGVTFDSLGILPSLDASTIKNTNILYSLLCFSLISSRINFMFIYKNGFYDARKYFGRGCVINRNVGKTKKCIKNTIAVGAGFFCIFKAGAVRVRRARRCFGGGIDRCQSAFKN